MLIMLGTFQVIQGLVALFDDGFYLVRLDGLVVDVDYNTWGWIHLVIGVVGVLTGMGLLAGNMAARVVGVVIAFLSALVNLAFISAYPVWSAILITLDVIVIYAIIVHGRELKASTADPRRLRLQSGWAICPPSRGRSARRRVPLTAGRRGIVRAG